MKKIIFLLALVTLFSCKENERLIYDLSQTEVFFRDVNGASTQGVDSMYVSLVTREDVSDVLIPVELLGNLLSAPKKFRVEVVPEKTTAVEGLHYQKLPDYYEFPTDTTTYDVPVVVLKGDEAIKEKSVVLTLRIVETEEIGTVYKDRSEIRLIIADMLKTPAGGANFSDDMTIFIRVFGEYSKVKHQMIIDLVGHDFWDKKPNMFYQLDYYIPYGRKLYTIITGGEYYDENGKLMEGWSLP